ncbi:uncharacterized protein LOC62_05G007564 [Vanrija pseudolonga]|uniref:Uncharacterized protein n=1 Tax=Vanrija pseudolonga TaxID=143232 RepID=A0AAF1BKJ4_9TREE|nr:hypothetical protein LOC62_05G007564 [Vanrija pseudolonga]
MAKEVLVHDFYDADQAREFAASMRERERERQRSASLSDTDEGGLAKARLRMSTPKVSREYVQTQLQYMKAKENPHYVVQSLNTYIDNKLERGRTLEAVGDKLTAIEELLLSKKKLIYLAPGFARVRKQRGLPLTPAVQAALDDMGVDAETAAMTPTPRA